MTIDTYFDKIYYINMDKDVDRNQNILKELKKANIKNYKRISGTIFEGEPEQKLYRNFIKGEKKYIMGHLGCRLSHLKAIRDAKENNYKKILILEDDIVFLEDPNKLLDLNANALNTQWDMLYFGGLVEPQFRNQIVCVHAYGVSARLYDDILNMMEASGMETDNFYAKIIQHMSYNHSHTGKYITKVIVPFNMITQNQKLYGSNIN